MVDLSMKRMGFAAANIPQSAHIYEVRERYVKKGSKWVLVKADTKKITVAQYADSCNSAVTRMFNAKRSYGYTEWGRICVEWSSISPNKAEKVVSHYYTPQEWGYRRK